ncbi:MAG TPA: DcrB-related protein [Solirubrobacterales bacterium]|nr:DcrB-related protein [Solirubrobacterales bacterium]
MQTARAELAATIPDDWRWKESLTLLAGKDDANVMFSSEAVEPDVDAERYAVVQGEQLRSEFPGYRQIAFEPMRIMGGRDGFMRRFEWKPPDGVEVTQIQMYWVESSRGYTATATTSTPNFHATEGVLVRILESLALDRTPSPPTSPSGQPVT